MEDNTFVESSETYERILSDLKSRADRIKDDKINCIPFPFKRFSGEVPGIEQSKYVIVTANSKVGKTKITDFMFLYNAVDFAYNNPNKLRIKIFYFTLEISADEKYRQFISHMLYVKSGGKIKLSPTDLKSIDSSKPLKPEILELLHQKEYIDYFNFFSSNVLYISNIRNPTGINKFCRDYAHNNGKNYYKKQVVTDRETKKTFEVDILDHYEQDDPDEYRMVILDHISLISPESGNTLHESITKLSSDYFVKLRNNYHYTVVVVQQQSAETESLDSFKMNKLRPSSTGLGDCKLTSRDVDLMLGLFAPFRHNIAAYEGYDITKFKDKIRFLEVIINRDGNSNLLVPLLFEGAVDYFKELPNPTNTDAMAEVYKYLQQTEKKVTIALFGYRVNNNKYVKNFNIGKNWLWEKYINWRNSRIRN